MNKRYLFLLTFFFTFTISFSQTIEDIKKLGLTESQLRTSFESRQILLTNISTGKRKKIKEGAYAVIKMKGDTSKFEVILSAFLADTIVVASLTPQLAENEIKLGFTDFKLLSLKNIESIEYSVRYIKGTYWASFLMTLIGLEMAVLPVIMPLIIGNSDEIYSQPQFPFMVTGGVILFIVGKKLQKTLVPKEYKIGTEWNYDVVKK